MNEVKRKEEKLFSGVMRLNSKILGLVLGLLVGLIIFIATNWLVIMGGHTTPIGESVVGPHLGLLGQFFIGYKVSFLGSFIGFAYGFALGSLTGSSISWIYNLFVCFRN
jgi:hypothetical protein